MTLLLHPDILPSKASELTLIMALAVEEGIEKVTGMKPGIKWPNDIILSGKKTCGILTEMSAEIDYINYVVIGVGINVNQNTFAEDIKDVATSLKIEKGSSVRRAPLVAAVMESFEKYYEIFMQTQDLTGVIDRYNELLLNRGEKVRVLEPGHEYEAMALGINENGELIVHLPDGEEKEVYAGEVSVRGVYGYV